MKFFAALLFATGLSTGAVAAPHLLPHTAVYDVKLDEATDGSGISGLTGRMVFAFSGSACEGYTMTFRFVSRIDTVEASRTTDQQTTTFESASGDEFHFLTKSFVDSALDHEVRGQAHLSEKGLEVNLDKPDPVDVSLKRSQFPTAHLRELIEKAEAGVNFYETSVFDGADDADQVMITSVVIGKQVKPDGSEPDVDEWPAIKDSAYWPVTIAYFNGIEAESDGLPAYRIAFKLYNSGISRDLVMDYGEFSLNGQLVDLKVEDSSEECQP